MKDATKFIIAVHVQCNVSIHASVKDATKPFTAAGVRGDVSIHASVKDATNPIAVIFPLPVFQSTRP